MIGLAMDIDQLAADGGQHGQWNGSTVDARRSAAAAGYFPPQNELGLVFNPEFAQRRGQIRLYPAVQEIEHGLNGREGGASSNRAGPDASAQSGLQGIN